MNKEQYNNMVATLFSLCKRYVAYTEFVTEKEFKLNVACLGLNKLKAYLDDLGIVITPKEKEGTYTVSISSFDENEWYVRQKVQVVFNLIMQAGGKPDEK